MAKASIQPDLAEHDKQFQAVMRHTAYPTRWDPVSRKLVADMSQSDVGRLALAIRIPLEVVSRQGSTVQVAPRATTFTSAARTLMPKISLAIYERRVLTWKTVEDGCIHFTDSAHANLEVRIPAIPKGGAFLVKAKNGHTITLRSDWSYEIDGRPDDFCIYVGGVGLSVIENLDGTHAVVEMFALH